MEHMFSQSTSAEQHQLDFHVEPDEVCNRIERFTHNFLMEMAQNGSVPDLETVSRCATNTRYGAAGDIELQGRVRRLSLTARQGDSAQAFTRLWLVLNVVHDLCVTGTHATQRDIYYRLKTSGVVISPKQVNEAIQDVVGVLMIARPALGIVCSSRGAYAGCVHVREGHGRKWTDCSNVSTAGMTIPGDCSAIERFQFDSKARYILVVEKDAIFQRLVEDKFHHMLPAIIVTAKGMPDMATRVFLHKLHSHLPNALILALVDWNPSGVAIMCQYKYGSARMALESPRYAVPLKWLGTREEMLEEAPDTAWQDLTSRDRSLINTLKAGPLASNDTWTTELDGMTARGQKAEIEALFTIVGADEFCNCLAEDIVQHRYLD